MELPRPSCCHVLVLERRRVTSCVVTLLVRDAQPVRGSGSEWVWETQTGPACEPAANSASRTSSHHSILHTYGSKQHHVGAHRRVRLALTVLPTTERLHLWRGRADPPMPTISKQSARRWQG
jgi:hypothetical protein